MTPWEVIEGTLEHTRPRRNLQWLADRMNVSIQVVVNWRKRGVPARRFRDIASALGITVDQLEGLERLPWEAEPTPAPESEPAIVSPEFAELVAQAEKLSPKQRAFVLELFRGAVIQAPELLPEEEPVGNSATSRRMKAA
jgi:hypothetical protein